VQATADRSRPGYPAPVLRLDRRILAEMQAHALAGLPLEACGLFSGDADGNVVRFYPCRNAAESSTIYTVAPMDHLRADRDAEAAGLQIIGVMHSHTHTDAYPSPTDVAAAPDPDWHYVIVSLREDEPMLRSYRIVAGNISEERVVLGE
jgi:[CysO sulfur-carrier protein]-S-L-cysteine hydrolase